MARDIADEFMHEVLDDLKHQRLVLPTLPEVALRVRDVVEDDHSDSSDVTQVIASDAALGARIVQVANSPLLRANHAIDSLSEAVTRLGMRLVRDLVISMVMEQMFQATSDLTDRKMRETWEHSTQVAAIAHALASQLTDLRPEQAMLAGLIHDIGVLPILTRAEDRPEILEDEAAFDNLLRRLHPGVGRIILEAWSFSPEMVSVAAEHERLDRDSAQVDYVDVVIVANLQSHIGTSHPLANVDWANVPAVAKLGLSPEVNIIEMDASTENDIHEVEAILKNSGN